MTIAIAEKIKILLFRLSFKRKSLKESPFPMEAYSFIQLNIESLVQLLVLGLEAMPQHVPVLIYQDFQQLPGC